MSNKPLHFIKIGGSVITDKAKAFGVNQRAIQRFAKNFAQMRRERDNDCFIIGNGAGSFGHYLARTLPKDTSDGYSPLNGTKIHTSVVKLNSMIVDALIAQDIPVISLPASAFIQFDTSPTFLKAPIHNFLQKNIVVSIYGDILPNSAGSWKILSTEALFVGLAAALRNEYQLTKCLILSNVPGVLDIHGNVIPTIKSQHTFTNHKNNSYDVTGGMATKLSFARTLAQSFHKVYITDGTSDDALLRLSRDSMHGTRVLAS